MCKCTPEIRTPFCGRPGCEPPKRYEDTFHDLCVILGRPQGYLIDGVDVELDDMSNRWIFTKEAQKKVLEECTNLAELENFNNAVKNTPFPISQPGPKRKRNKEKRPPKREPRFEFIKGSNSIVDSRTGKTVAYVSEVSVTPPQSMQISGSKQNLVNPGYGYGYTTLTISFTSVEEISLEELMEGGIKNFGRSENVGFVGKFKPGK